MRGGRRLLAAAPDNRLPKWLQCSHKFGRSIKQQADIGCAIGHERQDQGRAADVHNHRPLCAGRMGLWEMRPSSWLGRARTIKCSDVAVLAEPEFVGAFCGLRKGHRHPLQHRLVLIGQLILACRM